MTRRATKKMLHRAESAIREERFADAEETYRQLLIRFEHATPSLLDFAACVVGLIRTLYASGQDHEAIIMAERAPELLDAMDTLEPERIEVAA